MLAKDVGRWVFWKDVGRQKYWKDYRVQEEEEANKVSPNQLKISELIKHDN